MNQTPVLRPFPSGKNACPALAGLQLRVHTCLDSVETNWKDLLTRADTYVFQTWEWNARWQQHIGEAEGVQPRIIEALNAHGDTIGLWPLALYRQAGLRVLAFLGATVSDYRAPLLDAAWLEACSTEAFVTLWEACLNAVDGYDLVQLTRMPARFEHTANPMTMLPDAERHENAYAARFPAALSDFFAERSKQTAHARRKRRRLEEMDAYCHTPSHAREDYPTVFQELTQQKSRRWQETGSRDLFAEPAYLAFYNAIANDDRASAWVNLCSIKVGDMTVATHWGLQYRNRYYWILPTYAGGSWLKHSCGSVLQLSTIEWAHQQGFSVFDFTVGDEAYKLHWTNEHLPLYRWQRAGTLKGRLYLLGTHVKEAARASPKLRQLVHNVKRLTGRS